MAGPCSRGQGNDEDRCHGIRKEAQRAGPKALELLAKSLQTQDSNQNTHTADANELEGWVKATPVG